MNYDAWRTNAPDPAPTPRRTAVWREVAAAWQQGLHVHRVEIDLGAEIATVLVGEPGEEPHALRWRVDTNEHGELAWLPC